MFGTLTRETMEWHPDKLLCKRFNVPDPYPGSSIVGLPKVKRDKFSVFNFLSVLDDRQVSQAPPTSSSASSSSAGSGKRSRWDVAEKGSKVKDAEKQQEQTTSTASSDSIPAAESKESEAGAEEKPKKEDEEEEAEEEEVRPPMDLFKAIFASSSDEKSSSSSEEDSGEEEEEQKAAPQTPVVKPAPPVVPQAPPTSGLITEPKSRVDDRADQKDASSVQTADIDCEEFGPRLPPPGKALPTFSSTVREEKTKKQSKERHKSKKERKHHKDKKHKKKNKKHKHKMKQKKKKKTEETDSSSDDSDSDADDATRTASVSNEDLLQSLTEMSHTLHDPLTLDEDINDEKRKKDDNAMWEHEPLAQVLRGHADSVTSCHFCFHDTRLLTSSQDKTAVLWDVETGTQLAVLTGGHSDTITACCLVPEQNRVITSSWDKTINAWDMETGKILWTVTQGGLLMSCSVSGDGNYVASVSDIENALYVNCAATGARLHYIPGHHTSTVMSCRFDPQSQHLASVSADRSIKLWDVCSHKTTLTINSAHTNVISSCCFTQNGRYLCTASWDRTLQLWDVQTGSFRTSRAEQLSYGHDGSVSSCAVSADASVLVSGAYDRTVALWDVKGLYRMLVLKGHLDWVTDVDISTDKKWVVSSSKDCTVRLWNIEQHESIPAVRESRRAHEHEPHILQVAHFHPLRDLLSERLYNGMENGANSERMNSGANRETMKRFIQVTRSSVLFSECRTGGMKLGEKPELRDAVLQPATN
ncbi:WD repeat-containing protein 88 [Bagarius yarrelli]|uniref:WD repeat-containing protein 88 n=1 Tax=Bagarius yarrelli TaxID=175774 RepID=A0A556VC72_BAGYA|nr:WD repeat-containing protein 88 [Bagarius yarrelli]